MSVEKTLQTRIINKNGSYSEWIASDLVLKKGEIALVEFTTTQQVADGTVIYVPTYLMKVGDGTHTFSGLNWLSAPASDVYNWAKVESVNDLDLSTHTAITSILAAIDALKYDVSDNGTGFVTAVTQADGKITVTKKTITVEDISNIAENYAAKSIVDQLTTDVNETEAAIEALQSAVESLKGTVTGAMHFVGITTTDPTASGATVSGVASFTKGDVVILQVASTTDTPAHDIEFVNIDGANTTASWIELGDVTDEQKRLTTLESGISEIQARVSDIHTHTNKELLDTIVGENVHLHDNKTVIDGITAAKVNNWDTAYSKAQANESNISEETARIDVLYRYLGNGTNLADVLILDCGGVE